MKKVSMAYYLHVKMPWTLKCLDPERAKAPARRKKDQADPVARLTIVCFGLNHFQWITGKRAPFTTRLRLSNTYEPKIGVAHLFAK